MNTQQRHRICLVLACTVGVGICMLVAPISDGLALKPGEVSLVAEMNAGFRAVAARDPDETVRNPDYLAERFLPPNFWLFGPLSKDYTKCRAFIKAYRIRSYYTANALTRHIDAILQNMAANGLMQVVLIGAGFDSRSYRFGNRMPGVRFFEIDQPATLNRKMEMVTAVFGELPHQVTYIPIDYRTQPVFDALQQAGYDRRQKTLFIWEGATRFTDRSVVDLTFRSIATQSAPGSEAVFDYLFDEVVRGDYSTYRGARFRAVRLSANGEPWKFGIPEGRAAAFVTRYGMTVRSDLGPEELARKYLVRRDGTLDGKPTPYVRVMHVSVNRQTN